MKYLIILIITISTTIFGLKIEDNTVKSVPTVKKNNKEATTNKKKNIVVTTKEEKKEAQQPSTKENNDSPNENELEPVKKEDFIMPKAEDMGRVFIIPTINFNSVFSGITDSFFTISSDFEYNTGLIYNTLAIYANIGAGAIDKYFLLHLEGGAKYNLPRLTRFMKPFIKLGLVLNPYFTSDAIYIPSTLAMGVGFKFFISNNFAFEESQDFQIGKEINNGDFNMFLRFKLGVIFIF